MLDPLSEMATLALFALMVGIVIFGGTTLGYLLGERQRESRDPRGSAGPR